MSKITRAIIRPIVTLLFAVILSYGFVKGMIAADVFVPIASIAITWWFTARDNDKTIPIP